MSVVVRYRDDLCNIGRDVAAIRFQHDLAVVMHRLQNICEAPSSYWTFGDEYEVAWVDPSTGRRQRWSKVSSHLHTTLQEGCDVRVWDWRACDLELGWQRLMTNGFWIEEFPANQTLSFLSIIRGSPDCMMPRDETPESGWNPFGEESCRGRVHGGWTLNT